MNARQKNDIHCQDMCPCIPAANATVPPPQGFWDNRQGEQRMLRSGSGDSEVLDEPVHEFDALGARREPAEYVRWRLARDRRLAAGSDLQSGVELVPAVADATGM